MYRIHTSYSKHTAVVSTSMPCDSVSTLRPDDLLGSIVHLTAIMGRTALPNVIMGSIVLPYLIMGSIALPPHLPSTERPELGI